MREADAQAVLLVAAFEEADTDGEVIPAARRSAATDRARALVTSEEDEGEHLLRLRARDLLDGLLEAMPFLQRVLAVSRGPAGWVLPTGLVMALVGGLTNALGPSQQVHVLFAPLLGLVAWNLLVMLVLAVMSLRALVKGRPDRPGGGRDLGGLAARLAEWCAERATRRSRARRAREAAVAADALGRFGTAWRGAALPLIRERVALVLHVGALALVAGAVAGMYVRGVGLAYHATWESTFLDAAGVDRVLAVVLGPASWVLGRPVPEAAGLVGSEASAAPWIHLYAVTAAVFVILPRGLLACLAAFRAARLARHVPLEPAGGLARRLVAPVTGQGSVVDVLTYSLRLPARSEDALRVLLHDVFGARADVVVHDPLDYGAELADLPGSAGSTRVLVFGLAQPPETEVHGHLLGSLRSALGAGERLLVIVDGSAYRDRVGPVEDRLPERRRSWDRVVKESGLDAVHLELDRPLPGAALEQVASVVAGGAS